MSKSKQKIRDAAAAARPLGGSEGLRVVGGTESVHGLPPGCPVVPLGLLGNVRFYLDSKHQLMQMTAREHARLDIMGLFGEHYDFLWSHEPWQRQRDDGRSSGWRPELVAQDLMAACGRAGVWDAAERERGRGAWRGEDGELLLHCGDRVMIFPRAPDPWAQRISSPPGLIGKFVYPTGEQAGVPADIESAIDDPGGALLDVLETWHWQRGDLDAVLMLGWVGAAMIGGALEWRSVVWLTGGKGTGKSSLQNMLSHVFGGQLISLADASGAAIWQKLGRSTLPVNVDELEAEEDNRKALAVVKVARLAASGGQLARGSDKHKSVTFTLRSCFLFGSINIPPLSGADRSRIAILSLLDLPTDQPLPDLDPPRLRAIGAQLRRRMIDGWPRLEATLERYRRELAAVGHSKRGADQFATLLACADLLLFRDATNEVAVVDWISRMHAADMAETADDMREEDQCLQHLLSTPVETYRGGDRSSLGEWINRAAGRIRDWENTGDAHTVVQGVGVRIVNYQGKPFLAVANNHSGLAGLFKDTRWTTPRGTMGVWVQAFRRLPGAVRHDKAVYFRGINAKVVLIPMDLVPTPNLEDRLPIDR